MAIVRMHGLWIVGLLTVALAASGCVAGGCSAANGSSGQKSVCNKTDSFSFGQNSSFTTSSDSFKWHNTQTKASVNWGSNLGMGSVSVQILDASGAAVFSKNYSGSGQSGVSSTTSPGTAGDWTIKIDLRGATGQIGIQVAAAK